MKTIDLNICKELFAHDFLKTGHEKFVKLDKLSEEILSNNKWDELYTCFNKYLRENCKTEDDVTWFLICFMNEAESKKWTNVQSQKIKHETQIMSWVVTRTRTMDSFYGVTVNDSAFKATLNIDNNGFIETYKSQDYTAKADYSLVAVTRNAITNLIDEPGDGQINFKVIVPLGYNIDTITINGTC